MPQGQTTFEERLARLDQRSIETTAQAPAPTSDSGRKSKSSPQASAQSNASRRPLLIVCGAGLVLSVGLGLSADRIMSAFATTDTASVAPTTTTRVSVFETAPAPVGGIVAMSDKDRSAKFTQTAPLDKQSDLDRMTRQRDNLQALSDKLDGL